MTKKAPKNFPTHPTILQNRNIFQHKWYRIKITFQQKGESVMDIWEPKDLVDQEAIDNLTDEQVDQILAILKNI
jgi:hypothetical protein